MTCSLWCCCLWVASCCCDLRAMRKSGDSIGMSGISTGSTSLFVPCWYPRKVLRAETSPANMFLLFISAILAFVFCLSQHWLETHVSSICMNFGHFRKVQIHTNMLVATSRQAATIAKL